MTTSKALLVLGFLAVASAAPWPSSLPRCSTECPIAGSPKLAYAPQKSYVYSYTGKSQVHLKDVEGGVANMEWSSQVELSWITPCDVAISIKNPSIAGASGSPDARFLERYPLVVAMIDGRVQQSCSHPDDDVWSVNLKKGIASAFQNSLPSNSSIASGLNVTETDVIGNCSTMYEVKHQGEEIIFKKMKNHRYCQDLYVNKGEKPTIWNKAPLPMEESRSECTQKITKGIYSNIKCKDTNIIRPFYGSYKYVEAHQESVLQFQSETDNFPPSISNLRGPLIHRSLRLVQETPKKDLSLVAKVDEELKQTCEKIKDGVKADAASHVGRALHYLRLVPEQQLPEILRKIRAGQICPEHQKLEALFLDAVAFIHEPGAVKIMIDELLSGKATSGRSALYNAALYLMPRPCIHSVQAVKPLLEAIERFPREAVAAATMVNVYCKHNPKCHEEPTVRQIAEILSNKISSNCPEPGNENAREEALIVLKALGNMGIMNSEIARPIISCMEKVEADNSVRAAAAQVFRNIHCSPELKPVTRALVSIVTDPRKGTETRIQAYLAAMRCPDYDNLLEITSKISREHNTQVRGFILSHLLNIQESDAPYKADLKYLLTNIALPSNYTSDWRTTSRNIDMSYYAPTFGIGAGLESNLIHVPGSFLPRSLNLNLTAALGATSINMGEVGVRFAGLEPLLEELFGPEGYMKKTSMSQIFEEASSSLEDTFNKIWKRIQGTFRQRRSIDSSTLTRLFSKLYGDRRSHIPMADFYARLHDQDILFGSLAGNPQNINIDQLIDSLFDNVENLMRNAANAEVDAVRTAQIYRDINLPTIQGIPISMRLAGTAVAGLKMKTNLSGFSEGSQNILKFLPSLSSEVDGFIGFDAYIARAGVKMTNQISTAPGASLNIKMSGSNGFEAELDLPERMELINVKSETYLLKEILGQPETKIHPSSVRSTRVQMNSCLRGLEPAVGLKLCYDINAPNIFSSEGLPLGQPTIAKLFLEKSDSSMRGYHMKANVQNAGGKKEIMITMDTPGSSTPRRSQAVISYSKESENTKLECTVESTNGGIKAEFRNKWTSSEKHIEFDVYGSRSKQYSPDTKVIEAAFRINDDSQEVKVDTVCHTLNAAKEYIDLGFEVSGDLQYSEGGRIPIPRRLRKFEWTLGTRGWHLTSFIRKSSGSQYVSALKVGAKGDESVRLEATHNMEGSSMADFSLNTDLKAQFGSAQFEAKQSVYYNDEKIGTTWHLAWQGESTNLIESEMLLIRSGETYRLNLLLDIPTYIKSLKFEVVAAHQGSSQYQVTVEFKHGGNQVLHVSGPVSGRWTSELAQVQARFMITCLRSEQHTVSTLISLAPNKQAVTFELAKHSEPLLAIEWNMATQEEQQTKIDFKFKLPTLIEKSLNVFISERTLHLTTDTVVQPKGSSPLRLKGFFDVDFEGKKGQAEFAWDADRNPNKNIKVEISIVGGADTLQDTVINGGWTYMGRPYQFKTELNLADPRTWFVGRNKVKLDFVTPSHMTYKIESEIMIESGASRVKLDTTNILRTPESQEYTMKSKTSADWSAGPHNIKLETDAEIKTPKGQQSKLSIQAVHQWSPSNHEDHIQIHVTSPSLRQPLETQIMLMNQQNRYSTKWTVSTGSPAVAAMYELQLSSEGGVQSFKTELRLNEIKKWLAVIEKHVASGPSSFVVRPEESQKTYLIQYDQPAHKSHMVKVHTPSRKMEGEVTYSPSEVLLRFHPHKGVTESKYELYTRQAHSEWEKKTTVEGRISHPSFERDLQANVQYGYSGEKITGSVELDIFPRAEDKISGKLESLIFAPNTVMVEIRLQGKILKQQPKLILSAAYGHDTVGFDVQFHKTPSAPVHFLVSGKLDRSYGRNAALSFIVQNDGQRSMDIAITTHPLQTPECYGMEVEAKTKSSVIGAHDVSMKLCKPLYMSMITRKPESDQMYITRIGMKGMRNIEVSLSEAHSTTLETRTLGMARVWLSSPSLLKLETKYEKSHVQTIKNDLQEKWSRLFGTARTWSSQFSADVISQEGHSIDAVWQETMGEFKRIYQDLQYDGVIPRFEEIKMWLESDIIKGVARSYSMLWSQYAQLQHQIASTVSSMLSSVQTEFSDFTQIIIEAVMGTARSLQTGEMPEGVRRVWNQIQETSTYRTVQRWIEESLNQYPEEYQGLQRIIEKIKVSLAKEFEENRHKFMQLSKPQHIINWVVNHLNFDRMMFKNVDTLIKNVIQKALFVSLQMDENHVQSQLPIRRPVYSLVQAASYASLSPVPAIDTALWSFEAFMPTPADNIIWAYYTFLPHHPRYLAPPFNHTAVIVEGTEIVTFDGRVLRAPHSPCKILLAQHKSGSLIMQNQQPNALPHFTLKASGVTVEVKPDFTVTMNGQPVSGPRQTEREVVVLKMAEKVKVMTPYMTLRVYKSSKTASLEASGWAFGQMAGLLGTYDGEMGNDWMTPRGSEAGTLQELVKSWQEEPGCQTPSIKPTGPLRTPIENMIRCHTFFGVRSRCNPVVRQEPFKKMCYSAKNACHVAKAYGAVCATKGIEVASLGC